MSTDYRAIMLALLHEQTYAAISARLRCSSKTIRQVRSVLDVHGFSVDDVASLSDGQLEVLFPDKRRDRDESLAAIDIPELVSRMRRFSATHRGKKFRIKVEHERYVRQCQQEGKTPYSYSQYASQVSEFIRVNELKWPLEHTPGQKMFVDWSGDKMWVGRPGAPDSFQVSVFVATLPHSGLVFAKCYPNERTASWLEAHVDACNFFGGVPELFIPDNASTASFRPRRDDPARDVASDYLRLGNYYGAGILPTAPAQPTHKGHVERHVEIIQQWVSQYLDAYDFDALEDLNDAVEAQVNWLNHEKTPYRGINGITRYQEFVDYEQQFLKPLPDVAFEPMEWRWITPRPDCHIQVDKRRYSVPYQYVGQKLKIGLGQHSVNVYTSDGTELIVTHSRSYGRPGSYVSLEEHRPPHTKVYGNLWTRSRYVTWSQHIGPACTRAIAIVLDRPKIEQQAFFTCENILKLAKRYSKVELEQACKFVLDTKQYVGYSNIKNAITTHAAEHSTRALANAHEHSAVSTRVDNDVVVVDFEQARLRGLEAFDISTDTADKEA